MRIVQVMVSLVVLLMAPVLGLAITQCVSPQAGDGYPKVPTCQAGQAAPANVQTPFVAILEPALEQDDNLNYMNASHYRYVDLPVGQAYSYALYNDDPKDAVTINIVPYMQGGNACVKLEGLGKMSGLKSADCYSFDDIMGAIKPFLKAVDANDVDVINAWMALKPDIMQVKKNTDGAYLSVRYVQVCSGTLVSSNKVLTAAHCVLDLKNIPAVLDPSAKHMAVVAGANWQTSSLISLIDRDQLTLQSAIAPGYAAAIDESKDFAVLTLLKPITAIKPAVISDHKFDNEQTTMVAGFGMTEPLDLEPPLNGAPSNTSVLSVMSSPTLLVGSNTVMPNSQCKNYYSRMNYPTSEKGFDQLLCAGTTAEAAFCAGDSGGAFFVSSDRNWGESTEFTLYAVVSGKPAQCQNAALARGGEWVPIPGLYAPVSSLCQSKWFQGHGLSCQQ